MRRIFVAGGAGFIGSHFLDALLALRSTEAVTVYDNFSSGQEWHYRHHQGDNRLKIVRGDIGDLKRLVGSMRGHDPVIHLASNPDISKAVTQPDIDFWQGTILTQNIVEAMRLSGTKRILYASGSGVYGDLADLEIAETQGPPVPISTYGASKLAGEGLISSYCHMFGLTGCAFRFANVVGPRQTHGVGFDFIRKLQKNPTTLDILGDGTQLKSYLHVSDVVEAVLLVERQTRRSGETYSVFNVSTSDQITVREIAELAVQCAGLKANSVRFQFSGGDRGWKGDVPCVRLNSDKIARLGWRPRWNSREALRESILAMLGEIRPSKKGKAA